VGGWVLVGIWERCGAVVYRTSYATLQKRASRAKPGVREREHHPSLPSRVVRFLPITDLFPILGTSPTSTLTARRVFGHAWSFTYTLPRAVMIR